MSDDPTSQANFLHVVSTHIHFDWNIDFAAKVIKGSATHTLLVKEDGIKEVVWVPLPTAGWEASPLMRWVHA